jgi:hypothetical protein
MKPLQFFVTRDEFFALIEPVAVKSGLHVTSQGECIQILKNGVVVANVEIGSSSSGEFCESVMSFTEDVSFFSDVKKIKKHLKSVLGVGVWFVNKDLGVKEFYKEWLYSEGVENLAASGVRLVQFFGAKNFALIDRDASSKYSGVRGRIMEAA